MLFILYKNFSLVFLKSSLFLYVHKTRDVKLAHRKHVKRIFTKFRRDEKKRIWLDRKKFFCVT